MPNKVLRIQRAIFVIAGILAGERTTLLQHIDRCSAQSGIRIYSPY